MDVSNKDVETAKLADEIKTLLGLYIAKFPENECPETLTACIMALAIEVGRLRWLCVSTDNVDEDVFDQLFWEGVMRHFNSNKNRFGTGH